MPRKQANISTLITKGVKVGEPVPKAIVDAATASVGIPPQSDYGLPEELGALRNQMEALRQQIAEATRTVKGGARIAARQTEATVKLYPVSSLLAVAAVAGAIAFAFVALRSSPPSSRYDRTLDNMRKLYDRVLDRF